VATTGAAGCTIPTGRDSTGFTSAGAAAAGTVATGDRETGGDDTDGDDTDGDDTGAGGADAGVARLLVFAVATVATGGSTFSFGAGAPTSTTGR
jgi:hypothetical protein